MFRQRRASKREAGQGRARQGKREAGICGAGTFGQVLVVDFEHHAAAEVPDRVGVVLRHPEDNRGNGGTTVERHLRQVPTRGVWGERAHTLNAGKLLWCVMISISSVMGSACVRATCPHRQHTHRIGVRKRPGHMQRGLAWHTRRTFNASTHSFLYSRK